MTEPRNIKAPPMWFPRGIPGGGVCTERHAAMGSGGLSTGCAGGTHTFVFI